MGFFIRYYRWQFYFSLKFLGEVLSPQEIEETSGEKVVLKPLYRSRRFFFFIVCLIG